MVAGEVFVGVVSWELHFGKIFRTPHFFVNIFFGQRGGHSGIDTSLKWEEVQTAGMVNNPLNKNEEWLTFLSIVYFS